MIAAVIFDAFGTMLHIQDRQNPYRRLLRDGHNQGRQASVDDLRTLMTFSGGLREAADLLGINLSSQRLMEYQEALELELDSIRLFDDASLAIDSLRAKGVRIGLCSNLAGPYCSAVRRLLPDLEAYALSAELKLMKPDPRIYQSVCEMLGIALGSDTDGHSQQVVMIGDSQKCDQKGPRLAGVMGYHLDRSGSGRFHDLVEFVNAVTGSR